MERPRLAKVLLNMISHDQAAIGHTKRFAIVRDRNAKRLNGIIAAFGWPDIAMVGLAGAEAAWLIAQHSDHNPKFQRRCLALIKRNIRRETSSRYQYAYLLDRILVNSGAKHQRFGTQLGQRSGGYMPNPPTRLRGARLDKLRESFGLPPLSEYIAAFERLYNRAA